MLTISEFVGCLVCTRLKILFLSSLVDHFEDAVVEISFEFISVLSELNGGFIRTANAFQLY